MKLQLPKIQLPSYLKTILKIIFIVATLSFVGLKVDTEQIWEVIQSANIVYLLIAVLLYHLSQLVSVIRIKYFYKTTGFDLPFLYGWRLYYIGMFYNLLLPSSVGGDGYKVLVLREKYRVGSKDLLTATLLDRVSGLSGLLFLMGSMLFFSSIPEWIPYGYYLNTLGLVILFPATYLFFSILFKKYLPTFSIVTFLSLLIQGIQLLCAFTLLKALGIHELYFEYMSLFLIANLASVIPLSIGGIGIRELVFLYSFQYLPISETSTIAFSLLFFLVTVLAAAKGMFFLWQSNSFNKVT